MLGVLEQILCYIRQIGALVANGVVGVINDFLAAVAFVIEEGIALLPEFPELPAVPEQFATGLSWVAFFFPLDTVVLIVAFEAVVFVAWHAVAWALRWAKVIS